MDGMTHAQRRLDGAGSEARTLLIIIAIILIRVVLAAEDTRALMEAAEVAIGPLALRMPMLDGTSQPVMTVQVERRVTDMVSGVMASI
jgi:hypothetical protein